MWRCGSRKLARLRFARPRQVSLPDSHVGSRKSSEAVYLTNRQPRVAIRRAGLLVLVISTLGSERDRYEVAFIRGVRGRTDQNFELISVS
jgi:hypothetical protein